jgi:hypothetical protein
LTYERQRKGELNTSDEGGDVGVRNSRMFGCLDIWMEREARNESQLCSIKAYFVSIYIYIMPPQKTILLNIFP